MILLDTHVLLWLVAGSPKLGRKARRRIDRALANDELAVAAITFWEVAMLIQRGRVQLAQPVELWRDSLFASGLAEVPFDSAIGIRAAQLEDVNGDPADRIILATAMLGKYLVTADTNLLEWKNSFARINASS